MTGRDGVSITAGIADLVIMKTSHSAFEGYPRDEFTTLPETKDRLFATSMTATWTYAEGEVEYASTYLAVRKILLEAFAEHDSFSVQHTLYAMGQSVLDSIDLGAEHQSRDAESSSPADRSRAFRHGESQRSVRGDRRAARPDQSHPVALSIHDVVADSE